MLVFLLSWFNFSVSLYSLQVYCKKMSNMRVAVVGSGISRLVSAYVLTKAGVQVVLYEKEDHLGSHVKTVTINGVDLDLSFMNFNRVTCPNTMELFETLGVDTKISDMSFSLSLNGNNDGYEWGSRNGLSSLFAQKSNMLNPSFLKMLWELNNFKGDVVRYLEEHKHSQGNGHNETLQDFIKSHGYSGLFQKSYLIPICSSLWSCPAEGVLNLSAFSVLSYFNNHHLFELKEELESKGCEIRTGCVVQSAVKLDDDGCLVVCEDGSKEKYSRCIIDANSPDTLKMLGEQATYEETRILGAFSYVYNDIFLHHDKKLMPRNKTAWSALNFVGTEDHLVCLTYWLNVIQMQNINENDLPFLVTFNPSQTPNSTLLKWSTGRAVPSVAASKALVELHNIQGTRGIWFCGSYQGNGFHEDEMKAGMAAAYGILNKSSGTINNPKQMAPSLMEAGARLFLVRFLRDHIAMGTLILLEEGGSVLTFEGTRQNSHLKVYVKVHNPQFYLKVVSKSDIGLGEAYMNGDFSFIDKTDGLVNLIMIFIVNNDLKDLDRKSSKRGWWTPMFSTAIIASAKYFYYHYSRRNSITQARSNISRHYDLSNEFFSLFMDETMQYSSAIFKSEDEDLKVAQMRKISLLIKKARVNKNHQVLDIGCGWGTLAIEIVKQTGCKYTGITLSIEQIKYAESKVKEAGLQEQIKFLLCDYRQLHDTFKYDRIIACECMEHVGHEYYDEFFGCCESALAEDGILVMQFTYHPDGKYDEFRKSAGFIREYIFPGGCIPSLNRLTSAMASSSRLCVDHVEKIGIHYYRTIRRWRKNMMNNRSKILALGFDQEFIRAWEYYFDSISAGFMTGILGSYQVVFSRPGNVATLVDPDNVVASAIYI